MMKNGMFNFQFDWPCFLLGQNCKKKHDYINMILGSGLALWLYQP